MKLKVPCGRNVKQPGRPVGRQRSQKVRARRATAALMVKRVQRSAPRDPPESTRSATWLLPQSSDGCRRAVSARARLRCTPGRPRGLRLAVVAHGAPCGRGRARGQAPPRHGKTTNSYSRMVLPHLSSRECHMLISLDYSRQHHILLRDYSRQHRMLTSLDPPRIFDTRTLLLLLLLASFSLSLPHRRNQ